VVLHLCWYKMAECANLVLVLFRVQGMAPEPGEKYWLGKHKERTPGRFVGFFCSVDVLFAICGQLLCQDLTGSTAHKIQNGHK